MLKTLGLAALLIATVLSSQKYVTYIDKINQWWPPAAIAEGIAVPSFATDNQYNVINLAFLLSDKPADIALIWSDPLLYFGSTDCPFGQTKAQIQANLTSFYHQANTKILVSAFGATEFPTTEGRDPVETGTKLAQFVKENDLDGIDLDWEDNAAMENGTGEQWLIDCVKAIRKILPVGEYLLTHAPQAPYFIGKPRYPNGAYVTVHQEVGHLIDWYNIQFYNQGSSGYNSYEELFIESTGSFPGTAVKNIIEKGVPQEKVVIGKPVTSGDAANTGWVDPTSLGEWAARAKQEFGWDAGIMTWQYPSDVGGKYVTSYKAGLT